MKIIYNKNTNPELNTDSWDIHILRWKCFEAVNAIADITMSQDELIFIFQNDIDKSKIDSIISEDNSLTSFQYQNLSILWDLNSIIKNSPVPIKYLGLNENGFSRSIFYTDKEITDAQKEKIKEYLKGLWQSS